MDSDPETALAHAAAARRLAPRTAAVREAAGLTAYHAGEWQTAMSELRAYHRMTGRQTHLAVLADCERALGRPERAIDLFRTADRAQLGRDEATELLIVAAGARGDLGQHEAAVAMLQVRELTSADEEAWAGRLRYAYADALLAAGRRDEAREWFARAAEVDTELSTDAVERLLDLDGIVIDDETDEFEESDKKGEPEEKDDQPEEKDQAEEKDDQPEEKDQAEEKDDAGDADGDGA
jgi:tetratricopeptide (TPR) repeat protein